MNGKVNMEVLLIKDVVNLGLAGQVRKVPDGYARNFLFPRKLAIVATPTDVERIKTQKKLEIVEEQILGSRVAMLAEHIKKTELVLKKRVHDNGKLYGAVGPDEIVDLLKAKNIQINRKQVEFPKAVRAIGEYEVIIRLTSKLKPTLTLRVVEEK